LREGEELRVVVDRQIVCIFPRETWLRLLMDVEAGVVEDPSGEREEVFVALGPPLPGV
jgi:hypothetical protein